jgi:hypothetical protein
MGIPIGGSATLKHVKSTNLVEAYESPPNSSNWLVRRHAYLAPRPPTAVPSTDAPGATGGPVAELSSAMNALSVAPTNVEREYGGLSG